MPRQRRNPFYAILGVVGVVFVITASSYCLSVLRGLRPESRSAAPHALERWIDRHGTTALTIELVLLAIATVGSITVDEMGNRDARRLLDDERRRSPAEATGTDGPAGEARRERP